MWTSWQTRCGIAAYTASLVGELRRLGVVVDVVPVPYTDRDPARAAETVARLNEADLVHVQHEYTFWGGIAPMASSLPAYYRQLRPPRVVTAHTVFTAAELLRLDTERRPRQRLAKRLLAAYPPYRRHLEAAPFLGAEAVVVHTEAARDRMIARGVRAARVHVLPAGIPSAATAEPDSVARFQREHRLAGRKVMTIFGYVNPDKGYEVALEALAKMPEAVKLVIAGGPRVEQEQPYLDTLERGIEEQGLAERVAITGYLEDAEVAAAMAATDLVLVPHTAANGSYSVMVALSHGKPVLASDLACFQEIAEQSACVELFTAGDETALAERAGFLLASAGTRSRMADAARQLAAERGWVEVARRTLAIYEEAVRSGG
jgi:glycosyltransferase involved in cell wall biosynthesis